MRLSTPPRRARRRQHPSRGLVCRSGLGPSRITSVRLITSTRGPGSTPSGTGALPGYTHSPGLAFEVTLEALPMILRHVEAQDVKATGRSIPIAVHCALPAMEPSHGDLALTLCEGRPCPAVPGGGLPSHARWVDVDHAALAEHNPPSVTPSAGAVRDGVLLGALTYGLDVKKLELNTLRRVSTNLQDHTDRCTRSNTILHVNLRRAPEAGGEDVVHRYCRPAHRARVEEGLELRGQSARGARSHGDRQRPRPLLAPVHGPHPRGAARGHDEVVAVPLEHAGNRVDQHALLLESLREHRSSRIHVRQKPAPTCVGRDRQPGLSVNLEEHSKLDEADLPKAVLDRLVATRRPLQSPPPLEKAVDEGPPVSEPPPRRQGSSAVSPAVAWRPPAPPRGRVLWREVVLAGGGGTPRIVR